MIRQQAEPLPAYQSFALSGLFLITEDGLGVAPQIAQALQQQGASPTILSTEVLQDREQLAAAMTFLRQNHGPVKGIVHLAALAELPIPDTLMAWRQANQSQVKTLFQLVHSCADDLQQSGQEGSGRVLATSLMGGYFGRNKGCGSFLSTGGGYTGLLKSLRSEWPGVIAKAVDLDSGLPAEVMAEQILQELLLPGGRVEVGYPQGKRTIFQTIPAPLSPAHTPQMTPSEDWVVLVTGGARGITAEIVAELVVPGMQLILLGTSPEPAPESASTVNVQETRELRQVLLQQAVAQGLSPTPVQIEQQLASLLRDRAIRSNLARFRHLGAKVDYRVIDVRDSADFGTLLQQIYQQYGHLEAVIHGAGIIEDKLIIDKTLASFEKVFDTKVDSAFTLGQHLQPQSLKLLVFFTSVAGRYGNRGQSDYAAANEILNRLAWQLDQQWPETRVVSINWGPWQTGMASDGVQQQFKSRGIVPIAPAQGCQAFLEEVRWGGKGEVEVVIGEGPWEAVEAEQEHLLPVVVQPESQPQTCSGFPLLSAQPQLQPNSVVTLQHTFSLANDPYLQDHCLEGKPVLPAAVALEWMAELVQAAWPEWTVQEVRDLRVLRGCVFERQASRDVVLTARAASHADAESLQVTTEILDPETKAAFYRASVILSPQLGELPQHNLLPLGGGNSLDPAIAYHNYLFHGSRFQLLTGIEGWNESGIDAQVSPSQPSNWVCRETSASSWLFDPGVIDTIPQLALIWARTHQGTSALPSRFGSVIRYRGLPSGKPLRIAFRVKAHTQQSILYDAWILDQEGNVYLQMQDCEGTCSASLNRLNSHWRAENGLTD